MTKTHGPISHIALNMATYDNCMIEANYLNFFYGCNGTGKSTIARAIAEGTGLTWSEGNNIEKQPILVYDRTFIEKNFSTYESLHGVFTVGQTNIEAEKQLANLRAQRAEQDQEAKQQNRESCALRGQLHKLTFDFYETCWSQSQKLRSQFPDTQNGRK